MWLKIIGLDERQREREREEFDYLLFVFFELKLLAKGMIRRLSRMK